MMLGRKEEEDNSCMVQTAKSLLCGFASMVRCHFLVVVLVVARRSIDRHDRRLSPFTETK